jgi:cytochrome c556
MSTKRLALWVVPCLLLSFSAVQAQDDSNELAYRQKLMQIIGDNKSAIDHIAKNGLPYQGHIATYAKALAGAGTLIESTFKKEIVAGRTDSKPEIWQEWDKYVAAAQKLTDAGTALAVAVESGDDKTASAAIKALGRTCGGCHKPYRKGKAERFKRD